MRTEHFSSERVSFAAQFAERTDPVDLYEMPIAVTGSWVKDGHRFSITSEDLYDIVRNFDKRKNGQIVVDFEHASERPEVARGGPVPAAGWIHDLEVRPAEDRGEGEVLWASVEWVPDARKMLKDKKYKFFSPAIDWGGMDKKTGRSSGARLTSSALTNHPFLEELPEIRLSSVELMSERAPIANGQQIVVPIVDNAKIKVKIDSKHKDDDREEMGDISLDQKRSAISDAIQKQYGGSIEFGKNPWVKEVFDDHAIIDADGKLFRCDYSMDKRGNVKLGKPKQVEVSYQEVKPMKAEMTDMQFTSAIVRCVEMAESRGNNRALCAEIRRLLGAEGEEKALSEKVVKLLDELDRAAEGSPRDRDEEQFHISGEGPMRNRLRKEALARAKKIDEKDDSETDYLKWESDDNLADKSATQEVLKRTTEVMKKAGNERLSYSQAHSQVLMSDNALRLAYLAEHRRQA